MKESLNFLFTTWEGGGNVTPVVVAARQLLAVGHTVRVISEECNRQEFENAGARFTTWKRALNRQDRSPESQTCRDWEAPPGPEGLISVLRDVWCGPASFYAEDVIEELQRESADLVVTCEGLFGVMIGCESVGQRFATLCPNICLSPLPGVPPLGPGLRPATSDGERAEHAHIAQAVQQIFDTGLPSLNATRKKFGLSPLEHTLDQFRAAAAELIATSPAFDFPSSNLPNKVRYVGPLISDPGWAQAWTLPANLDDKPLVAVSFSTTFQNHAGVLQNVIDALAPLPVQVLVTLGGSIGASDLNPSENCLLLESAPHSVVFPKCAFVVTHGGHGTVTQALLGRVPQLVIPHGRDQNDNAVRVTERGAGLSLLPNATVEEIRNVCQRLLNESHFASAARRLGDLIALDVEQSRLVEELELAARVQSLSLAN